MEVSICELRLCIRITFLGLEAKYGIFANQPTEEHQLQTTLCSLDVYLSANSASLCFLRRHAPRLQEATAQPRRHPSIGARRSTSDRGDMRPPHGLARQPLHTTSLQRRNPEVFPPLSSTLYRAQPERSYRPSQQQAETTAPPRRSPAVFLYRRGKRTRALPERPRSRFRRAQPTEQQCLRRRHKRTRPAERLLQSLQPAPLGAYTDNRRRSYQAWYHTRTRLTAPD